MAAPGRVTRSNAPITTWHNITDLKQRREYIFKVMEDDSVKNIKYEREFSKNLLITIYSSFNFEPYQYLSDLVSFLVQCDKKANSLHDCDLLEFFKQLKYVFAQGSKKPNKEEQAFSKESKQDYIKQTGIKYPSFENLFDDLFNLSENVGYIMPPDLNLLILLVLNMKIFDASNQEKLRDCINKINEAAFRCLPVLYERVSKCSDQCSITADVDSSADMGASADVGAGGDATIVTGLDKRADSGAASGVSSYADTERASVKEQEIASARAGTSLLADESRSSFSSSAKTAVGARGETDSHRTSRLPTTYVASADRGESLTSGKVTGAGAPGPEVSISDARTAVGARGQTDSFSTSTGEIVSPSLPTGAFSGTGAHDAETRRSHAYFDAALETVQRNSRIPPPPYSPTIINKPKAAPSSSTSTAPVPCTPVIMTLREILKRQAANTLTVESGDAMAVNLIESTPPRADSVEAELKEWISEEMMFNYWEFLLSNTDEDFERVVQQFKEKSDKADYTKKALPFFKNIATLARADGMNACIGVSVVPVGDDDTYICYRPGSDKFAQLLKDHPRAGVFMKLKGCWEIVGGPAFRKCVAMERKHCKQTCVSGYYLEEIASSDDLTALPKVAFGQAATVGLLTFGMHFFWMYDVPGAILNKPAYDHDCNADGGIYKEIYDHVFGVIRR